MSSRLRPLLYWLPAIAVVVLIFVLSSQSGLRVSEDAAVDKPFRITGHLLAFATLAACLLLALSRGRRPRLAHVVIAFAVTVLYGASDEWHQSFVPDRTGRLDDLVVDTIGVIVGLGLAAGLTRFAESLLFGVSTLDVGVFALMAGVALAVATLASWVPARKAASVDPMSALREE